MKHLVFVYTVSVALAGCSTHSPGDYSYPNVPYYVSSDECGGADAATCSAARAQAKVQANDAAAVTWGSLVALTLLASIDVEPEQ